MAGNSDFERVVNGNAHATTLAADSFDVAPYVTSQWQRSSKVVPPYLVYRWIMAVWAVSAAVHSYATPYSGTIERPLDGVQTVYSKWFLYATNLGFLHIVVQALLGLYLTQITYNEQHRRSKVSVNLNNNCSENGTQEYKANGVAPKGRKYDDMLRLKKISAAYQYFYSAAAAHAIEISVIYWCGVYEPEIHVIDAVNIMSHTFNSVFMIMETYIVRINSDLSVVPRILLSGLLYGMITYPYWLLGGTDRFGKPVLYPFLDFDKPVVAIIFLSIISFGAALMVFVHMALQTIRLVMHQQCFARQS